MRRVAQSCSKAAGVVARKFASSAGETATSGVDAFLKPANVLQAGIAVAAALIGAGYALHTVDAKLLAMEERLKGHKNEVDATVAGTKESLSKEVAGARESLSKEVAGAKESLSKEVAGALKEVDAKVAGVSDKAKAEALMVLKDYGVAIAGGKASKA